MKKIIVKNLLILDESGSMHSIEKEMISGFNETVQTIKNAAKKFPNQIHDITWMTFNTNHIQFHLEQAPIDQLEELNAEAYRPNGGTPLFDALAAGIHSIKRQMRVSDETHVLVSIFTDGMENASVEYRGKELKKMIEELSQQHWTFTYIGTDHDIQGISNELSIENTLRFQKTKPGIQSMFEQESASRIRFYDSISRNETKSYFSEDE